MIQALLVGNVLKDADAPNGVRTDFFGTRLDIQLKFTHERSETRFQEVLFLLIMKIKGGSSNIGPLGNIGNGDLFVASFNDELKQRLTKHLTRSLNTPIKGSLLFVQRASCRVEDTRPGFRQRTLWGEMRSLIHVTHLSLNRQFHVFCSTIHKKAAKACVLPSFSGMLPPTNRHSVQ